MSQISITTIQAVRELPIENIIGQFVELKRAGASLRACCPLHGEKTPSFYVTPAKNMFKCFGCGAGGDAIKFVMLHENIPFQEAVRAIAKDQGIEVVEKEGPAKTPEQAAEQEIMLQLMLTAEKEYRKSLDMATVKYLVEQRHLTRESIIEWQLGVCLDWKVIAPMAIANGQFALAEKCGLVRSSDGNNYDYFHHRITIPIHNKYGQVVGFGGRKISGDGPKYMNSPESEIYNKSATLFGLDKAIKPFSTHGMAVLVEGYFDVIKLHQCGWNNAVASCGTALTEHHAKTLRRYTDTVLVLRDGDNAGINAMEKDIPVLVAAQLNVIVAVLPKAEDPDTLFDCTEKVVNVLWNYEDGIEYLAAKYVAQGQASAAAMATAIEKIVQLLAVIDHEIRVEQYIKILSKKFKLQPKELSKPLDAMRKLVAEERAQAEADAVRDGLPAWVDRKKLEEDGFVQLAVATKGFKPGIYFPYVDGNGVFPVTNFTLKPLYHVYEQSNNRRLMEVFNCTRNSVVEMPSQGFVNQGVFETELVQRGNFRTLASFQKAQYKRVIGWLSDQMPLAYELKTLGWQPEGFFAFADAVWHAGNMMRYDDMGMITVDDKVYLSLGKSKIHRDERVIDNPYENDLYLSYTQSDITFEKWAQLFSITYGSNAPYGIAFAFLTIFKDIATRITKMPMLYLYGPKGSGKSAMAESLTWLFFSGKNGEGDLIKGFNLNPGQGTPFSFFNRVERFRNCPVLFNEFDENNIEDWKFGTFKAAYDGEGREVGDGDTGKKRKTRIQKIQGTVIIVGQYISIKDDGSVLSRSISCQFSLDRLSNLSADQNAAHESLKHAEQHGLSSLLLDLLKHREQVKERLPKFFLSELQRLTDDTRKEGERIEARLLNNYSLILSATKMLSSFISLPYSYDDFYHQAKVQVMAHNKLLKDNSAINIFWKGVEFLFDQGFIQDGTDIKVVSRSSIEIKVGTDVRVRTFPGLGSELLLMRFSNVFAKYAKSYRERTGQVPPAEDTLLLYMRDQPYYVGLTPRESFNDKRTSCFVFDYMKMRELGITLEKDNHRKPDDPPADSGAKKQPEMKHSEPDTRTESAHDDDLPF